MPQPLAVRTDDGAPLGTPAYMSPEQIRGEDVDLRSDLFSLGIVMYELASGTHPFAGSNPASTIARILEAAPPRLGGHALGEGAGAQDLAQLDAVVATCLRKTVGERYRSAHELIAGLEQAREAVVRGISAGSPRPRRADAAAGQSGARWWWQFHQAAASLASCALLVPLWLVHRWVPGRGALLVFLGGLVAAVVASTLRLHLWFAVRSYPDEWAAQRRRTARWLTRADALLVAALLAASSFALAAHAELGVLLVSAAVVVLLSFTVIEPATTRAAFHDRQ